MAGAKKQNTTGILAGIVIAIGLVALIFMMDFGERKTENLPVEDKKKSAQPSSNLKKARNQITEKLPESQKAYTAPSPEFLSGSWKTEFGKNGIAVLSMALESFQLIVTNNDSGRFRKFSRGTIKYNQERGILSLIPTREAGVPDPIKGVTYKILTMRAYDMQVAAYDGDPHLYLVALDKDLLAKTYHPLFKSADHTGAPVLRWEKLE